MAYVCITQLEALQDYLKGAAVVAFDLETAPDEAFRAEDKAALDAHKSHIAGLSFSVAEGSAVYVPLAHQQGVNTADPAAVLAWLRAALFENNDVIKVAHNLSFEAMFLYALGIVLQPPCYDTIAAAQLTLKSNYTFRTLGDSGLKTLVPSLLGIDLPGFEAVTGGRHFDELDAQDTETLRYACADSDYTLRLYHLFNAWFDRYLPKHRALVEQVESPTAVYAGLMKFNGLPVDTELMREKQDEAKHKLAQLREDIAFMIGDVNIGANAGTLAFKKYLYEDLQLPVFKVTARYSEAIDDEALLKLKDWCAEHRPELVQVFALIQDYRRWGKVKATYIDGYRKCVHSVTGRIHPDLLPLATATGRFAARNPNLQNTPKSSHDEVGVRNFFIAQEGKVFLSLDFSQIELRVAAFYCRDEKMLDTYRNHGDIHAQTLSVIYGIPLEQALDKRAPDYKERRSIAKNCNFGTVYGLFPKGLQRTLKVKAGIDMPLADCERIIANLKAGYPGLALWQAETCRRAGFDEYVETWLGRRRYLPDIGSRDWKKRSFAQRKALNTPIQGTAADILKLAMVRIVQGLPDRPWLRPLLQIHDELLFELPAARLREAADFVRACMETQPFESFDVPIVAEAAVGTRFGTLRELEDNTQ